eukprot:6177037-Pleurochrysis_carterae.AAC.3
MHAVGELVGNQAVSQAIAGGQAAICGDTKSHYKVKHEQLKNNGRGRAASYRSIKLKDPLRSEHDHQLAEARRSCWCCTIGMIPGTTAYRCLGLVSRRPRTSGRKPPSCTAKRACTAIVPTASGLFDVRSSSQSELQPVLDKLEARSRA